MSARRIIDMHHALAARADNATADELDTLALQYERIVGKQACWRFATDLRTNDRAERVEAYRAAIEAALTPAPGSDIAAMQARLTMLEASLSENIGLERAGQVMSEMAELGDAISRVQGDANDAPRKMLPPVTIRPLKTMDEGGLYDTDGKPVIGRRA